MARRALLILLVVVMLLSLALLTACETAGSPQPTATSKPAAPSAPQQTKPVVVPTPLEGYPTPATVDYP